MNKFKEIRPIVLGLVIKDGKILISEGYDKVKKQTHYRCLGGGIEFLEKSNDALKREFKEELDIDITVKEFLGVTENIFTYEGQDAHELVLFYSIEIKDDDYKEQYEIIDEPNHFAKWVDINTFKSKEAILYPVEILQYL